jgi:uncharacterized protein involved in exopolysaccharide biosynthesis
MVMVTTICVVGAFTLPRKYESSTTILVRPDETLHPIQGFEITMAFEEQLRNFNEIIYSRTLLLSLADSLGLTNNAKTEAERMALAKEISGNINTTRLGSDSFRIAYVDTDPDRAQRAARVITDLFIQTKLNVANRQNTLTVEFYEKKVQEYREGFEQSVQSLVSVLKQNVAEIPAESRSLYAQIDEADRAISSIAIQLKILQNALTSLRTLPEFMRTHAGSIHTDTGKRQLIDIMREDLPFVATLRTLVSRYDSTSHFFTERYPDVVSLENQIIEHLDLMAKATEAEIVTAQSHLWSAEQKRGRVVEELKKSSTASRSNEDKQSNYDVNRRLYDEMKMKLEQARLAQEVGSRGANQFIVLDPAFLPTRPTKPNRAMIVAGGFALGLFLGIISAAVVEFLDTTVRTTKDIQVYQKPVIALLPAAKRG